MNRTAHRISRPALSVGLSYLFKTWRLWSWANRAWHLQPTRRPWLAFGLGLMLVLDAVRYLLAILLTIFCVVVMAGVGVLGLAALLVAAVVGGIAGASFAIQNGQVVVREGGGSPWWD